MSAHEQSGGFSEAPPEVGTPDWSRKMTDWWWRKCKHRKVDPVAEFERMLDLYWDDSDNEQLRRERDKT